jgi:hypothetical protein
LFVLGLFDAILLVRSLCRTANCTFLCFDNLSNFSHYKSVQFSILFNVFFLISIFSFFFYFSLTRNFEMSSTEANRKKKKTRRLRKILEFGKIVNACFHPHFNAFWRLFFFYLIKLDKHRMRNWLNFIFDNILNIKTDWQE